jgi:hypothetical protein
MADFVRPAGGGAGSAGPSSFTGGSVFGAARAEVRAFAGSAAFTTSGTSSAAGFRFPGVRL